jgi:hypothetical protein
MTTRMEPPLRLMVRMRHKLIMWNMRYIEGWIRRTLDRVMGLGSEGPRLIIPGMIVSAVADWPISVRSGRVKEPIRCRERPAGMRS